MEIKLLFGESYSEASVCNTVHIPVPKTDREEGDVSSVLAVVEVKTGESLFPIRLGTRDGRIK